MSCFKRELYFVFNLLLWVAGCTSPAVVATQSARWGDLHNNQGNYTQAIEQYQEYLKVAPQLGIYRNTVMEAEVRRKLAHAYSVQNRYDQAEIHLQEALRLDTTVNKNKLTIIEDYRALGLLRGYQGNYTAALDYLEKAMVLGEVGQETTKTVKKASLLDTYLAVARVTMVLGDFEKAEKMAAKAERLLTTMPGNEAAEAEILLIKGIIYRESGDLEMSERLLRLSGEQARENSTYPTRQLQALAQVELRRGAYEEALRNQLQALRYARQAKVTPQIITALSRLGDIYKALGDSKKAEHSYLEAMNTQLTASNAGNNSAPGLAAENTAERFEYYESQGARMGAALSALKLGQSMIVQHELGSAGLFLQKAHDHFFAVGSEEGLAEVHLAQGELFFQQKRFESAFLRANRALIMTQRPALAWKIWYLRGKYYEEVEQADSALLCYEKSQAIVEMLREGLTASELKSAFASDKLTLYDRHIRLLLSEFERTGDHMLLSKTFEINEKARARSFLDMLGNQKVLNNEPGDQDRARREQQLRIKIHQLDKKIRETERNSSRAELYKALHIVQRRYQDLLLEIKLHHPAYSDLVAVDPPPLTAIQQKLDPGTVILEYWVGEHEVVAWVLDHKKLEVNTLELTSDDLKRELDRFSNSIAIQDTEYINESLRRLYTRLIQPLEDDLRGYDQVIIVPHGRLHFLPFGALLDNNDQYLLEKQVISIAPSSSTWYYCKIMAPALEGRFLALALGNAPVEDYPGLPATTKEVDQLSKVYQVVEKRVGADFTEGFFKSKAHNARYLHVATHGVFNKRQPGYSYLLMHPSENEDGKLTVNEIFNLRLDARLVTLSACDTGLGEITGGDDLVGLSRAFIYGGTPAVVVSLWKVQDAVTAILMTRFYQYLQAGYDVAYALNYAQRDLINNNITDEKTELKSITWDQDLVRFLDSHGAQVSKNPFYWAAFIMMGN